MPITAEQVKETVLASASDNAELLSKLASTEDAPGNFALHQKQISRLQDDLKEQNDALESLKVEVEAKFKVHKKFNDSTTRKILYRASFMQKKFEERATKGEQEYFSFLAKQSKAEERQTILQNEFNEAEKEERGLQERLDEHGALHLQIDSLYESLFAGPTPGFDREDNLETKYYAAKGNHEATKSKIVSARQAARQLKLALRYVKKAIQLLHTANVEANTSFLFFDEAHYALNRSSAEIEYAQSAMLKLDDILRPKIPDAERKKSSINKHLIQGKIAAKIPSSREAYGAVTSAALEEIISAQTEIEDLLSLVATREENGLAEIKKTARTLEDSRQALHQSRMGIFEEVAGFGQAAPSYRECCDRADAFCELPPPPPEVTDDVNENGDAPALPDYDTATSPQPTEQIGEPSSANQPGTNTSASPDVENVEVQPSIPFPEKQ